MSVAFLDVFDHLIGCCFMDFFFCVHTDVSCLKKYLDSIFGYFIVNVDKSDFLN